MISFCYSLFGMDENSADWTIVNPKAKPEVVATAEPDNRFEGADVVRPLGVVEAVMRKAPENRTNSEAERIINDPALRTEFEEKTGISLSGMSKAEQRAAVKGYKNPDTSTMEEDYNTVTKDTRFYIADIVGQEGDYGDGVVLDTDIFDGVKPRNWGKVLTDFVYNKLAGKDITVYDDNGNAEIISFAKKNERVTKDGANNSHRVIDKLARAKGNINALATVHIDELLQTSREFDSNTENNHQWLDENGWSHRKTYIMNKKGKIYEATLNIAKAKDGRNILYALSNIREVDDGAVPSAAKAEGLAHKQSTSQENIIADNTPGVKSEVSTGFSAEETTPQSATQTAPLAQGSQGASFEEEVTGGRFKLSDKVDLSHVEGKIDPNDKRITDSIVLSSFLGDRFGVRTQYIYDPNGRFCGKHGSGTIFINLAKLGNKTSFEVLAHEFGHALKVINPSGYRELFVMVKNSTSLASQRYIDFRSRVYKKYKELGIEYKQDEIDDVAFSELLSECFVETFKNPESLTKISEGDKRLYEKLREVILELIDNVKNFFAGRKNENIRRIVNDFDAIERKIVEIVNESKYQESFEGDEEVRYDITNSQPQTYDYTKSFSEQIDDYKKGNIPQNDSLLVGATPKVFQKIGFNSLPVTINQEHVDYAINGTKDIDHSIGESLLKQLPQALENPVAIIKSQTQNGRVVAILKMQHNGKNVIVPIEVDGSGRQNNIRIDSNAVTSVFGKSNAITKQLKDALDTEINGSIDMFYWNKKEALSLLQRAGLQLPSGLPQDGFIHSIDENGANVNKKFKNVTETQQFKRWFGKSKVVNKDGTPKVVYHGTNKNFTVFKSTDGTYWFSESRDYAEAMAEERDGENVMSVYLSIKNPYRAKLPEGKFSDPAAEKGIIAFAKANNYDGAIIECDTDNELAYDKYYVAFEPTQIKSATNNIGTFDGNNPDIDYMPEGGYFDEDVDYGYTKTTERNVKEIDELVDMEGNVRDTSQIPTKRKLSNTKPKVLTKIELIDRQIEGCREILRDPMSPKYKEAEKTLERLYEERDRDTMIVHKTELLQELRGALDGADVKRHGAFIMSAVDEICSGDKSRLRNMIKKSSFLFTDFERNMKRIFGEK